MPQFEYSLIQLQFDRFPLAQKYVVRVLIHVQRKVLLITSNGRLRHLLIKGTGARHYIDLIYTQARTVAVGPVHR